jgi:hypothetical protein
MTDCKNEQSILSSSFLKQSGHRSSPLLQRKAKYTPSHKQSILVKGIRTSVRSGDGAP